MKTAKVGMLNFLNSKSFVNLEQNTLANQVASKTQEINSTCVNVYS